MLIQRHNVGAPCEHVLAIKGIYLRDKPFEEDCWLRTGGTSKILAGTSKKYTATCPGTSAFSRNFLTPAP